MDNFIIAIDCGTGTSDRILGRAPEAQAATRAEPGCIIYDFYICTNNPGRLVFVEAWGEQAAHDCHLVQDHTKAFIACREQFHENLIFETINAAS